MPDETAVATPPKPRTGFAAMTPEARRAAQAKSAATRAANRAAKAATPPADRGAMPPDPPPNYGRLPESGSGGAVDPATRDVGGLGERALASGRPLAPDIVGLDPSEGRPPARVAHKEADLPFHKRGVQSPKLITAAADAVPLGTTLQLPDWETADIEECKEMLGFLSKLMETAAVKVQARVSASESIYHCVQCGNEVRDLRQAKMVQARRDPETGIITNDVWCSHRCFNAGISSGAMRKGQ